MSVKEDNAYYIPFITPGELFQINPDVIFKKLSKIFESNTYKFIGQNDNVTLHG